MTGEFKQQLRMAAVQVSGLKPDELAMALAYEVEPFSGIPAAEAEVKYEPVLDPDPMVRVYNVTVRHRGKGAASRFGNLERWLKPAIGFAALVGVVLLFDFGYLRVRSARLKGELVRREPLEAEIQSLKAEVQRIRASSVEIRERRNREIRAQDEVAARRAAYSQGLLAIARAFGDKAVIKQLAQEETEFSMVVSAVAVSPEAASEVMMNLDHESAKCGWHLDPGEITASPSGIVATFSCRLWK